MMKSVADRILSRLEKFTRELETGDFDMSVFSDKYSQARTEWTSEDVIETNAIPFQRMSILPDSVDSNLVDEEPEVEEEDIDDDIDDDEYFDDEDDEEDDVDED